MKKIIYIFVLLMANLSCTNTEEELLHEVTVSFSPALYSNTRTTEDNNYPTNTPFRVWAYSLPVNAQGESKASNASVFMNNEMVSYQSGSWTTSEPYQWKSDKKLTFFAYSPASVHATCNYENGITIPNHDMNDGIDLLYASPLEDVENLYNNGCISLPFRSAFAQVNFKVRSMMPIGYHVHLKKLFIEKLAYKGTFQLRPKEKWITTADRMPYDFYNGDREFGYSSEDAGTLTLMPQTIDQPIKMLIDLYDSNDKLVIADKTIESATMSNCWKPGKYYSYTLNIYSDSITFTTDIIDGL